MRGYQASRNHGNADSGGIEECLAGGVGVSQEKILAPSDGPIAFVHRTVVILGHDGQERSWDAASIAQRYLAH
jgi:hypothetical protein